jgi:hypothetical protein
MPNSKQMLAAAPPVPPTADDFVAVPAGGTTKLGTGAVGDVLGTLVCVVATTATSQVQIQDGNGSAITVLPNNATPGIGTYVIPLNIRAKVTTTPGWNVITGAGVTVLASGVFT